MRNEYSLLSSFLELDRQLPFGQPASPGGDDGLRPLQEGGGDIEVVAGLLGLPNGPGDRGQGGLADLLGLDEGLLIGAGLPDDLQGRVPHLRGRHQTARGGDGLGGDDLRRLLGLVLEKPGQSFDRKVNEAPSSGARLDLAGTDEEGVDLAHLDTSFLLCHPHRHHCRPPWAFQGAKGPSPRPVGDVS